MTQEVTCPECGSDKAVGWEVGGVYDGVLVWHCENDHIWPRFGEEDARLHQAGLDLIASWQRKREEMK